MKLWNEKELDAEAEAFTVGDDFLTDLKLAEFDCVASIAHAKALCKAGILTEDEAEGLEKALNEIIELVKTGEFKIKKEEEDCHTAVENFLVGKLGELGKKIHAGRSRNDQVLTAIRLYTKHHLAEVMGSAKRLSAELKKFGEENDCPMPGYTHMRRAMPSSLKLWANAFAESLEDDAVVLKAALELNDQSPLGSAAGYGSPLDLDKALEAELLGFRKVQEDPLYCQNSRGKFELFTIASLHQVMLTLNKLSTDLLLFSTQEFGFMELPDELCTGSSMMPQKKNPDVLELVRAKSALILGNYVKTAAIISSLPSGYNRDLQETKKPLIESLETTLACLNVALLVVGKVKPNKEKMSAALTSEVFAAGKALELAKAGTPFRDAYVEIKNKPI